MVVSLLYASEVTHNVIAGKTSLKLLKLGFIYAGRFIAGYKGSVQCITNANTKHSTKKWPWKDSKSATNCVEKKPRKMGVKFRSVVWTWLIRFGAYKFQVKILQRELKWLFITVLVLIKLTKFAVALRLRCGSCKFIFWHYFIIFR